MGDFIKQFDMLIEPMIEYLEEQLDQTDHDCGNPDGGSIRDCGHCQLRKFIQTCRERRDAFRRML